MKYALMLPLALVACGEPRDYGRCLETRHIAAHTEVVPRMMDPLNPVRVGGLVIRQVPARDVCDRWEFPEGREFNSGK
jgi:hypothetical protein